MSKIVLEEQAAADTPATNKVSIYPKAGGELYRLNDAGDESQLAVTGSVEAHKTSHQNEGTDEISVVGLSGLLADDQHVLDTEVLAVAAAKGANADITSMTGLDDDGIPGAKVVAASETTEGVVELATNAEVAAFTDENRVVTPEGLGYAMAGVIAYGVDWDEDDTSPTLTRTGALAGIAAGSSPGNTCLPIQAAMRRCILSDAGVVQYYLAADDSTKKVNGTASDYYMAGVKASLTTWGLASSYSTYISNPGVAYAGTLEQIIEQKWIASWTAASEAWFDYRRTGYPAMTAGPVSKRPVLPLRFYYGINELSFNPANAQIALNKLETTAYTAPDGNNSPWSKTWLLQGTGKPW